MSSKDIKCMIPSVGREFSQKVSVRILLRKETDVRKFCKQN